MDIKTLLLTSVFTTNCKFIRRRLGGAWYKIEDYGGAGGFGGSVTYWARDKPAEDDQLREVIKTENYTI